MTGTRLGDADGGGPAPDLDPATLLGGDYEAFEQVVSGETSGPLAVVGPPYGGRKRVLAAARDRLDAVDVSVGLEGPEDPLPEATDRPVVVGDCQHLYTRTIGGFEPVERLLDALAGYDAPVVTGWNRYAWAYLAAVRGVDRAFPTHVETGPVSATDLGDLLRGSDEAYRFLSDETPDRGVLGTRRVHLDWRGRTVSIPVPTVNLPGGTTDPPEPETAVFDRLAAIADGNPGTAAAVWERLDRTEVRPTDLVLPVADPDLDRTEAFCLRVVLAKERVTYTELAAILGDGTDRVLGRLVREGLVEKDGAVVTLDPSAVPTADAVVERGRFL